MDKKKPETKLSPEINGKPISAYQGTEKYIFLSYAHADEDLVFKEIERFTKAGYHIWYDDNIKPGSEWTQEIAEALSNCSLFVLMVTPTSVKRRNVQNEINYALNKEKPLIAIHLEKTVLPEGLELQIGVVQAIHKCNMTEKKYNEKFIAAFDNYGLREKNIGDGRSVGQKPVDAVSQEDPVQTQREVPAQSQSDEPAQIQSDELTQTKTEESASAQAETAKEKQSDQSTKTKDEEKPSQKENEAEKKDDNDNKEKKSIIKKYKIPIMIGGIILVAAIAVFLIVFVFNKPAGDHQKDIASDEMLEKASPNAINTQSSDAFKTASSNALNTLSLRLTDIRDGDKPVQPASYMTNDQVLKDAAYTYDNALTAMAFIANNDSDKAAAILDAFVYAADHDRYKAGRIRNAYAAGNIMYTDDNGKESAKLPGWYDQQWNEDPVQVGSNVGNTSFAVLAMLQYDKAFQNDKYLKTAQTLMDWVMTDCADSVNGFTTGYNGWPEDNKETTLTYKSTAYNIAAYAAFNQLYAVTEREEYKKAANSALAFVKSMYVEGEGYFCTGTTNDGVTRNNNTVTLDAQVWSALALGEDFKPYIDTLDSIAEMKTEEGAYPYCKDNKNGGFWSEGTAFTALMYSVRNDKTSDSESYYSAMEALNNLSDISGLFPSASVAALYTGSASDSGEQWVIGNDPQVAPTAWFILAENGFNPFQF